MASCDCAMRCRRSNSSCSSLGSCGGAGPRLVLKARAKDPNLYELDVPADMKGLMLNFKAIEFILSVFDLADVVKLFLKCT